MYLGNRKARTRGYDHYLGSQKLRVPDLANLNDIVQRYRDGDLQYREYLIEHHMRLVMDICGRYHGKGIQNVDDLVSVAMLELVGVVDKAATRLVDNNITGYVVSNIHFAIYKYLSEDTIVRVPKMSQERGIAKVKVGGIDHDIPTRHHDPLIAQEMREVMCRTRSDREVLALIEKGYSDVEIARILSVPRGTIYQIKMTMKGRLNGYGC